MWWDNSDLEVLFDPNASQAQAGEVLVGLGDPQARGSGIVLNNKGALVSCDSISHYVMTANRDLLDRWKMSAPLGMAGIRRLVVEDLSLDTCFALLVFGNFIEGKEPESWCTPVFADYVTAYELGSFPDSGSPRNSLAILHSVLGHSYFEPDQSTAGDAPGPLSPQLFHAGFRACMSFLYRTLQNSAVPTEPRFPQNAPEYARALAHYDYEYEQYLMVLQHGMLCQLSLPVLESNKRRTVDALILEEIAPTAVVKVLARQDIEHSWTRKGFALLAIYRRNQALTGNDMTISLDPAAGLTLRDLWQDLERLEDDRWKEARPRDAPRDLISYRERDASGNFVAIEETKNGRSEKRYKMQRNAPNQPWYDDQGRFTLIAAPKAVDLSQGPEPGTRLGWREDVLPALWRQYHPIPGNLTLEDRVELNGRCLRIARWEANGNLSVVESPTFAAWLASCSASKEVRSHADLPSIDSFEVLKVAGGRAFVHREGVTLFDDWTSQPLDAEALTRTIAHVASASHKYATFIRTNPLESAMAKLGQAVRKQKFDLRDLHEWKDKIMTDKPALLAVATHSVGDIETPDQTSLRQALERHWGLFEQRDNALNLLDRIDATMAETLAELKERRNRLLTALAAGIGTALVFSELAEVLKAKFTMNAYEWQLKLFQEMAPLKDLVGAVRNAEHWESVVLGALIVGGILGFTFFWKWGSKWGASE
jgi:hypothetical protein